jgi:hypothetical protein
MLVSEEQGSGDGCGQNWEQRLRSGAAGALDMAKHLLAAMKDETVTAPLKERAREMVRSD